MALSAGEYLKSALAHERKVRQEKHTDVPTLPIDIQSDAGSICIKNRRGATWNALRDQAHTIKCTSFLEAAKTLQAWADQNATVAGDHPVKAATTARASDDKVGLYGNMSFTPRADQNSTVAGDHLVKAATTARASDDNVGLGGNMSFTPRDMQEMIAASVQQGLARMTPQSLALTNGGVGDTVSQAISQISQKIDKCDMDAVLNRAARNMIEEDDERVLERAAQIYKDDNLRAVEARAIELVDEDEAVEKYIEENKDKVRELAVDKYIEENEDAVHRCAIEKFTDDNAGMEVTHDQAVDRYIQNEFHSVYRTAKAKATILDNVRNVQCFLRNLDSHAVKGVQITPLKRPRETESESESEKRNVVGVQTTPLMRPPTIPRIPKGRRPRVLTP